MLDGIIVIDKEPGYTSHDVVAKMRGMLKQKKIGHTGTLDPDATGVLPVCIGKGTKVCGILTDSDKEYEAVLHLGVKTDTLDESGNVIKTAPVHVTEQAVRQAILHFVGDILQIPPMYSALKVNGQKLCDLAREGIEVERKPRQVTIHKIDILDVALPYVTFRVKCSKGTYIRTLCDDIGELLGTYGCMKSLRRTRAAGFSIENAITLTQLEELIQTNALSECLVPVDAVFMDYPKVIVSDHACRLAYNGNAINEEELSGDKASYIRLYDHAGQFIGVFEHQKEQHLYKPYKMFLN